MEGVLLCYTVAVEAPICRKICLSVSLSAISLYFWIAIARLTLVFVAHLSHEPTDSSMPRQVGCAITYTTCRRTVEDIHWICRSLRLPSPLEGLVKYRSGWYRSGWYRLGWRVPNFDIPERMPSASSCRSENEGPESCPFGCPEEYW